MDTNNENPSVFISYSWDDEAHKEWVLQLADRLSNDGINVVLDRYVLRAGKPLQGFIEHSLSEAVKVVIIFTPNYKLKAEKRKGGVGYEYSIITSELYENQANNTKFIPVLRSGTHDESIPPFARQLIHVDFTENGLFEKRYEELLEGILDLPPVVKPRTGKIPDRLEQKRRQLQEQTRPLQTKGKKDETMKAPALITKPKKTDAPSNTLPPATYTATPSNRINYKYIVVSVIVILGIFIAGKMPFYLDNINATQADTNTTITSIPASAPITDTTKLANKEIADNPTIREQADKDYDNKDYVSATSKYLLYADFLDAKEQSCLGYLYHKGLGVRMDESEAFIWYQKAADSGNSDAMYNIAILYEFGAGVDQDLSKAKEWYQKAADRGDNDAKEKLRIIDN